MTEKVNHIAWAAEAIAVYQGHCRTGDKHAIADLSHLAISLAPDVAERGHGVGCGKIGIAFDRHTERLQCIVVAGPRREMETRHPARKVIISIKAFSRLTLGPLDLGLLQLRRNRTQDTGGYLVLQIEDIFDFTLEPIGPDVGAVCCVDELPGNAYAVRGLTHTAFQDVAHAEFATYSAHVHSPALICKARITGDNEEPFNSRLLCFVVACSTSREAARQSCVKSGLRGEPPRERRPGPVQCRTGVRFSSLMTIPSCATR